MKQIPFRCPQGHVTILVFTDSSTKSVVICEKCIEELRLGRFTRKVNGRKRETPNFSLSRENLFARRY